LAFWTASIASARIALAIRVVVCVDFMEIVDQGLESDGPRGRSPLFYQTGVLPI
jgi:hypothetical protein